MAEFCEHNDDNDDAVTAANVEGRISITTIMFRVVTNVTNGECVNTRKQAIVPCLGLVLQYSLGERRQ
jgi:hypothetical protein